jgi:hypothetical protein
MDTPFDDKWRSDIVESYFDIPDSRLQIPLGRTLSTQRGGMLTAPPLEKSDSQWSPMSSGLVTPQDSSGYWSGSPERRKSGRFSESNRWSLGTQLSNVSFTECILFNCLVNIVPSQSEEWSTVDRDDTFEEEEDNIFHPDDEIILDPKESMEAPIKRVLPIYYTLIYVGKYRNSSTRAGMAIS